MIPIILLLSLCTKTMSFTFPSNPFHTLYYFIVSLSTSFLLFGCLSSSAHILCKPEERTALLQFKSHFHIKRDDDCNYTRTHSWKDGDEDCCAWDGVECDNTTGHIIELDLPYSCFYGTIPANSSLFTLIHIEALLLGGNHFNNSQISPKFGNLRNLTLLDLDDSEFSGDVPNEILQLQKLKYLDLSGNNRLTGNISNLNTKEIEDLYLSGICFSADIPNSIGKFKSLRNLDLSDCCLHGTIPATSSLFTLIHLKYLYLSGNNFNNSQISPKFGNLRNLIFLNLYSSEFSGDVPNEILQLPKLKYLDLSGNNRLTGNISNLNTTEMEYLDLDGICFFGDIPNSIGKFKSLSYLSLSDCCLHSTIPASLGNLTQLSYLDFGNNSLSGKIPSSYSKFPNIWGLDLSHNSLSGQPLTCMFLNKSLVYLDLSHNNFTGEIPACFNESTTNLEVLYLRQNNFHGTIPQSIGFANNLQILDLNSNGLQGVLPKSLKNCTSLEVLNLGGNMLMDGFPFWLGDSTSLKVLVLRDNNFGGTMKGMLPRFFTNLHIIDISHNDLTGNLPSKYFEKWNAMAIVDEKSTGLDYMEFHGRYYSVTIVNKGLSLPYEKILATLKVIDFSRNWFYDNIPLSLGRLKGVHVLNLSGNSLTGTIPISLGNLTSLESLDLSNNNLSGKMPSEINNLKFLEFLNVSQNNLSGVIPKGEQLNTFSSASYEANPNLCGFPLSKCTIPNSPKVAEKKNLHYKFEIDGFGWEIVLIGYTCGMILGVAIGCCILRNKEEWIMGIFHLKIHQSPKSQTRSDFEVEKNF